MQRAQNRNDILGLLVFWHGQDWLQQQRANFVSSGLNSRNSLAAGNTGARVLAQRPQKRFLEGIELASAVLNESRQAMQNSDALGLEGVIRTAALCVRGYFV